MVRVFQSVSAELEATIPLKVSSKARLCTAEPRPERALLMRFVNGIDAINKHLHESKNLSGDFPETSTALVTLSRFRFEHGSVCKLPAFWEQQLRQATVPNETLHIRSITEFPAVRGPNTLQTPSSRAQITRTPTKSIDTVMYQPHIDSPTPLKEP